jgi:SPP1 gp7 family putative phage head morphogenesis protein
VKLRTRKARQLAANAKRRGRRQPNPLAVDPTRTSGIRRRFVTELRRRFARVKLDVVRLLTEEDALGLLPQPGPGVPTANQRWRFQSDPDKVREFKRWLQSQLRSRVVGQSEEALWRAYVEEGFRKGAGRAFDDTSRVRRATRVREELTSPDPAAFRAGRREEFLRSAFGRPVAVEKVKLLAGRSFDDLEDITSTMSNRMVRALADGLVRGQGPREIARTLAAEVDIGRGRAETIARTEIIRSHAEGQLEALEQLGVESVGVAVEWSIADENACPRCQAMQGVVLKLAEARGMIPLHPS